MDGSVRARLTAFLDRNPVALNLWAVSAAFTAYVCMYAFRKPFTVAVYEGTASALGLTLGLKSLYVISQLIGYALSKFSGIKVISEMTAARRAATLLGLIGVAEAALLLFALTPAPYGAVWMFLNGMPLGMIWGLVFGFLEGRRTTEALGAGLSISYIVASGWLKSLGKVLLDHGFSEQWMPVSLGAMFVPLLLLVVWMLTVLPPPTAADEAARTKREPMDAAARRRFFLHFAPGLIALTASYVLMTAYRDFRDNFGADVWHAMDPTSTPDVYATTENYIGIAVLAVLALLFLIKDNRRGLLTIQVVQFVGCAIIPLATLAYQAELLSNWTWMTSVGLGLYLNYVPFGSSLFDRMIAATGVAGTAGFMIYVTDAFGYLGSVMLVLYKNFGQPNLSWLEFFISFSYIAGTLGAALSFVSLLYFWWHTRTKTA